MTSPAAQLLSAVTVTVMPASLFFIFAVTESIVVAEVVFNKIRTNRDRDPGRRLPGPAGPTRTPRNGCFATTTKERRKGCNYRAAHGAADCRSHQDHHVLFCAGISKPAGEPVTSPGLDTVTPAMIRVRAAAGSALGTAVAGKANNHYAPPSPNLMLFESSGGSFGNVKECNLKN